MTRAMLLCAGHGTRLGALSELRPKPMLPVCDIPILRYGIALLVGHGIRDIVINLHHRGEMIEREIGDGAALGARIQYIHEPTLLGTGGGLKNALPLLDPDDTDEPFLSLNGKLIFDLDIDAVLDAFRRAPDALGMMVVRPAPDSLKWGAVDVDTTGDVPQVRHILANGDFMFTGVHVTRPSVMRALPDGEACTVRQGYLPWIREGKSVAAFIADPDQVFYEHSTPARYLASNLTLLGGAALRYPPGPLTGIDDTADVDPSADIRPPVRIGPSARVGARALVGPNVVIGARATVAQDTTIVDSVMWPDTRKAGSCRGAIVTPDGVALATDDPATTV